MTETSRAVVILSTPLRKIYGYLQGRCDPKQSILSTFATFLLLSYSKLLFVSSNFLFAIQLYNSTGDLVPNSTVLLYDPSIPFFHSQHTPYITVALSAITIFILLPPLLLLLYPTRLFKRLLTCCRFQRWDILHMIMDTFQGWYKDGTEGTYDYRPLSALYMILRVSFVGEYLIIIDIGRYGRADLKAFVFGLLQIIPGTFFFIAKPYKKQWMNVIDGFILTLVGLYCIITKVWLPILVTWLHTSLSTRVHMWPSMGKPGIWDFFVKIEFDVSLISSALELTHLQVWDRSRASLWR